MKFRILKKLHAIIERMLTRETQKQPARMNPDYPWLGKVHS